MSGPRSPGTGRVDVGVGNAPLPAASVAALIERTGSDPVLRDRLGVLSGDKSWTHREYLDECWRWARWISTLRVPGEPLHLGVLLDNTPEYLAALGGCALVGATLVGLNHTRRGMALARDMDHTDVTAVVTEPRHADVIAGALSHARLRPDRVFTAGHDGPAIGERLDLDVATEADVTRPDDDALLASTWCLVFTSGTTSDPKAVICTQRRMLQTGERMRLLLEVGVDDVGYVSMPLFHSNSLMVGVMPALVAGAAIALAPRFSASGWLPDVRRYGATWFNYTGSPLGYILATPERPDDGDNPMRRGFGNEGTGATLERFQRRFGVELIDAFGPTEGGIAVIPSPDTPPGALGRAGDEVAVVDDAGQPLPRARLDASGRLLNPDEAVGEIVNLAGAGPFEGYYGNDVATTAATRNGWYWTGDLGYIDADGWLWFAGRSSDWLRVDGENFPAGPIEQALRAAPGVVRAVVYGVPDVSAGDQVMAALVMAPGEPFDPDAFARWLDALRDLGPKWRPRYVRVARELPTTGTNKPLVRELQRHKFRLDQLGVDELWVRGRGDATYRRFTDDDERALRDGFAGSGRQRFWDL